ncbi:MAG TPA: 50S ribosomal protein L18 [Candidatus Sulfotelmatobacter sp.]|nr:50S ribosomal protein L18 [Candidatus Sulfotelmatobacter sp.]
MRTQKKHQLQQLRRWRIRKKIVGSKDRPRMSVCFTNENIHVQFIDDEAGQTLTAVSTVGSKSPVKELSANVNGAKAIGTLAAKNALDKGITQVVFDRGGKLYHGKVKALADAAREAGLKF